MSGSEGVELLPELVLDSMSHPASVFPQSPDLLPGHLKLSAQRGCGSERGQS